MALRKEWSPGAKGKTYVYDVRWEDGDGQQGYFVRMTGTDARGVADYLRKLARRDIIWNVEVEALEADRVLSAQELIDQAREMYQE